MRIFQPIALALALAACSDRASRTVAKPSRIVSVTITGDVILQALVDSSRVQAVCGLADDSGIHEAAGLFPGKPRVGPDLERIVSLRPDLVLMGSFHDPAFRDGVRRSGLATEVLDDPNSLAKIREFLRRVSRRLGEGPRGDSLVGWMDSVLAVARSTAARCPDHPRVLYWSDGFTAGDSSTIGDMFTLIGARNVASELGIHGSKAIGTEDVVRLSPDWILRTSWESGGGMKPLPTAFQDLPAVRAGRIVVLPGKLLLSTSHRSALAAVALARKLHPDCP